jgi:predicted dinucleotide-binding enzyme
MSIIGIVGAGQLGSVLAKRLVMLGHTVKVANSRGAGSLEALVRKTGAKAVDVSAVGHAADLLILAIPLGKVTTLREEVIDSWRQGQVIVDAGNYVPLRDGRIEQIDHGMPETVWVEQQLRTPVVKAFNSISDLSLEYGGQPAGSPTRIALPVSGDDSQARAVVMRLINDLGFDALDAGPLADSWRQQLGQPAYCTDGTAHQLTRLLARAQWESVAIKRNEAMGLMAKLPADFPKSTLLDAARFMAGLDRTKPSTWLSLLRLARVLVTKAR